MDAVGIQASGHISVFLGFLMFISALSHSDPGVSFNVCSAGLLLLDWTNKTSVGIYP